MKCSGCRRALAALFLNGVVAVAHGDQWSRIIVRGAHSGNGRYACVVEWPNAVVRETGTNAAVTFRFAIQSPKVPLLFYVSNDGKYVVCLDRYMSEGNGMVLVIYSRDGSPPRGLTLEQIAGETERSLDDQLRASSTRRPWARRSIIFFSSKRGREYLCIWMRWSAKWALIDLQSGAVVRDVDGIEIGLRLEGFKLAKEILIEAYEGDGDVARNVLHQDVEGDEWRWMFTDELRRTAAAYMNYLETLTAEVQRSFDKMVADREENVIVLGPETNAVPLLDSGRWFRMPWR